MVEPLPGVRFVAGGSGGAGSAICERFAADGHPVALTYHRNGAKADEIVGQLQAAGVKAAAYQLDLTDADATAGVLARAAGEFGGLHSVIYAAGPAFEMNFVSGIAPASWAETMATDVNGAFNLFHGALAVMRGQKHGNLLSLSTCALHRPPKADVLSAAPKAAIDMLIKCIAKEEGRNGIRANTVELGFIYAGLARHHIDEVWTPDMIDGIKGLTPLKRFGTAEEVASAVAYLCSDEAGFITGQALAVDGGYQL
jgi:NAD(P)-dependent dehydrogenase (short-subunit alcohol dehydrogenase family)